LRIVSSAVVVVVSLVSMTQAALAVTALIEPDVAAFSSRAEQWTEARQTLRDAANAQALELAADGRQAEADRIAAEEAARLIEVERLAENERLHAAEDAARATTTTVHPTTTVPPTTVPPTTVPPTTVAPTTVAPTLPPGTTVPGTTAPVASDPPPTTTPPTSTEPPSPSGPSAAQWEVLRQCESSGNYSIVSANGRYRGAYQFSQATWNWVAGFAFPALAGVDPAAAAPSDQDAMALALWNRQGWSPWPICGVKAAAA
jgi:transglycosylase-like protein